MFPAQARRERNRLISVAGLDPEEPLSKAVLRPSWRQALWGRKQGLEWHCGRWARLWASPLGPLLARHLWAGLGPKRRGNRHLAPPLLAALQVTQPPKLPTSCFGSADAVVRGLILICPLGSPTG